MTVEVFLKGSLPVILFSDLAAILVKRKVERIERLIKYAVLIVSMKMLDKINRKVLICGTFFSSFLLDCFTWQISLYLLVRQLVKRNYIDFMLKPAGIYVIHLIHNYLLTFRADLIEPSYLRLWTQTLPDYYKGGVKQWIQEFGSQSYYYLPQQTDFHRLQKFPKNYFESFKKQFVVVTALYSAGMIFSLRSKKLSITTQLLINELSGLGIKVLRTSALLALLPYTLCSFPGFYANFLLPLFGRKSEREEMEGVRRNVTLHVGLASLLSTWVFLQEPRGRLKVIMAYSIWRIVEALFKNTKVTTNEMYSRILSSLLITSTVSYC